jgi:hypothetical protein
MWLCVPRCAPAGIGESISCFASCRGILRGLSIQHQTECHDPIAAVRKDKGEKIVRDLWR